MSASSLPSGGDRVLREAPGTLRGLGRRADDLATRTARLLADSATGVDRQLLTELARIADQARRAARAIERASDALRRAGT